VVDVSSYWELRVSSGGSMGARLLVDGAALLRRMIRTAKGTQLWADGLLQGCFSVAVAAPMRVLRRAACRSCRCPDCCAATPLSRSASPDRVTPEPCQSHSPSQPRVSIVVKLKAALQRNTSGLHLAPPLP
jgi:hypothetical protein